ncbi:MAG: zinc metalloprotease HtpX [Candidatus Omnitrophica bacterium]|nr:zinc metalloprotease HtpX [Candidatus Omnitrophota bacterium]
MNYFKTAILLLTLTILLVWIGGLVGGQHGALVAFIFAMVLNFVSFWYSDKIVLAMYKAEELPEKEYPEVYSIVRNLAEVANMPVPKIYVAPKEVPNAFATGRSPEKGVVCLTRGILKLLSHEELRGVIAHEMAHIKNRDTLIMTVAAALASAVMMLAYMARWAAMFGGLGGRDSRDRSGGAIGLFAVAILAPLAATLIQLAISRSREYAADRHGAQFARSGQGLANALRKLHNAASHYRLGATPQTAHLFIVNPLSGEFLTGLFMTHPPVEKRIEILQSL